MELNLLTREACALSNFNGEGLAENPMDRGDIGAVGNVGRPLPLAAVGKVGLPLVLAAVGKVGLPLGDGVVGNGISVVGNPP